MSTSILIPISDHPSLPLKRKIRIEGFATSWDSRQITVFMTMLHYVNNAGEYGAEYINQAVANFGDKVVALNTQLVDSSDGMELTSSVVTTTQPDPDNPEQEIQVRTTVYARIDSSQPSTGPVVGQFDFFDSVMKNTPVVVANLLTQYVAIQDQVKRRWSY